MAFTTLMTRAVAGSLFTASPPFSAQVTQQQILNITNPLLIQTELSQPEGTPLQLVITNYSQASTVATNLNNQYQAGKLVDQPTGEKLQAWAGYSTIAQASGSTLTIRWRKGQPFIVPIIWGIVIIAAIIGIYLIIKELEGSPWSLSKSATTAAVTATGPLGVSWWEWIAGGAVVIFVPSFVWREYNKDLVAHGQVRQSLKEYGPL